MTTELGYYFVRAMGQTEAEFDVFFDRGVVAVGWSDVDFTATSDPNDTVEAVAARYYPDGHTVAPQVAGRKKSEVRRFKSISAGDRILVPFGNAVRLASAEEEEIYDLESGHDFDLANQRRVTYLVEDDGEAVTVPRANLSEGLQRRLRVPGTTVSDLTEFADEIESLYQDRGRGWSTRVQRRVEEQATEFKATLLDNIRSGRSNLQAGGRGLEELVRDLLKLEGYDARILPKRAFEGIGDADVAATRADRFAEAKLLVQVKHHRGESGTFGADQLQQIVEARPDEYSDYRLVLVSTGDPSDALTEACESRDIVFVGGEELVDWIFDSLDHLSGSWKTRLGISGVPLNAL